jgi:hypothetical protein
MTITELLVACAVLVILMAGVTDIIVSGSRASENTTAQINAQQNLRVGFDRLEFEGRCASSATLVSGGAGVTFVLPSQCAHGGDVHVVRLVGHPRPLRGQRLQRHRPGLRERAHLDDTVLAAHVHRHAAAAAGEHGDRERQRV